MDERARTVMALRIVRPPEAFALSADSRKRPRVKAPTHLEWIRELPGLTDGVVGSTEAAHVRMGSLAHGKPESGLQKKPDDKWTVPLSAAEHRRQHSMNEEVFWRLNNIDPLIVAPLLWSASGDTDAALQIMAAARDGRFPFQLEDSMTKRPSKFLTEYERRLVVEFAKNPRDAVLREKARALYDGQIAKGNLSGDHMEFLSECFNEVPDYGLRSYLRGLLTEDGTL
jgi:hypothetical protein